MYMCIYKYACVCIYNRDVEIFEYELEENERSKELLDGEGYFHLRAIKA